VRHAGIKEVPGDRQHAYINLVGHGLQGVYGVIDGGHGGLFKQPRLVMVVVMVVVMAVFMVVLCMCCGA
jgi:hypothetical protein